MWPVVWSALQLNGFNTQILPTNENELPALASSREPPEKKLKLNLLMITVMSPKSLQPKKIQLLNLMTFLLSFLDLIKLFDAEVFFYSRRVLFKSNVRISFT